MTADKIIDSLGGTGAVAAHCGLHKSTVSLWRKRGIPRPWQYFLEQQKTSRKLKVKK